MTNDTLGRLLQRLAANRNVFDWTRYLAHAGAGKHLARALALRDGERLLDIGCGTGIAAGLRKGFYVGIDQEWDRLEVGARRRHSDCAYAMMSAQALAFRAGAFDKAVCIHMVHHLEITLLDAMLAELSRVVRGAVVVLDAAPDAANPLERFLLRYDRGRFVRSRDELRAILSRRYVVQREDTFHNAIHTVPQVLFLLTPVRASDGLSI